MSTPSIPFRLFFLQWPFGCTLSSVRQKVKSLFRLSICFFFFRRKEKDGVQFPRILSQTQREKKLLIAFPPPSPVHPTASSFSFSLLKRPPVYWPDMGSTKGPFQCSKVSCFNPLHRHVFHLVQTLDSLCFLHFSPSTSSLLLLFSIAFSRPIPFSSTERQTPADRPAKAVVQSGGKGGGRVHQNEKSFAFERERRGKLFTACSVKCKKVSGTSCNRALLQYKKISERRNDC